MTFDQNSAVQRARQDLASRLGISEKDIDVSAVTAREFPDMSLGAPADDEMAAQMIADGWEIKLGAKGKNYEYRADKYQLRLKGYNGKNHVIEY
jgi:hypothetical protein